MTTRERSLAMMLLGLIVVGGVGFFFYQFFMAPLNNRNQSIKTLQREIEKKNDRVAEVEMEKQKLQHWREISLPQDVALARREYAKHLEEMLKRSGFGQDFSLVPKQADTKKVSTGASKKEPFTRLTFTVTGAHASLDSLVQFLDRFYRTNLLHQIKTLTVRRPSTLGTQQRASELDIDLTVEALIVAGAENRTTLMPASSTTATSVLARSEGQYDSISAKDIFFGPTPVQRASQADTMDVRPHVYLTDITRERDREAEGWLYNRWTGKKQRLRASGGFNVLFVQDGQDKVLARGQVVRVTDREIVFRATAFQPEWAAVLAATPQAGPQALAVNLLLAKDKFFEIKVGKSVQEALAMPLSMERLKELGLWEADKDKKTADVAKKP